MSIRHKLLAAAFAVIACTSLALSQGTLSVGGTGFWPNWPIVGQGSYCSSTGNNSVCTNTVPAGPSGLTGRESFPANTGNTTSGPANVLVGPASLNALPLSFTSVINSGTNSITASSLSGGTYLISGGTIALATVWLPPAPINGQQYLISANQNITSLSVQVGTAGQLISNAPTALTTSTTSPMGYELRYDLTNTTWRRVQ